MRIIWIWTKIHDLYVPMNKDMMQHPLIAFACISSFVHTGRALFMPLFGWYHLFYIGTALFMPLFG